jgi:XTP/dITP diphosphohydrolase
MPEMLADLPLLKASDALVVATHNAGKLREIAATLESLRVSVIGADRFNLPEPEETGLTFEENAILKAESGAALASGHMVLADDSGLEVDALKGAPGIYSARWAGAAKNFTGAMQRVHDELIALGVQPEGQRARFVCVLALAKAGCISRTFRGTVEGCLTFPPRGEKGFGYDPIFMADGHTMTFAEMEPSTKHAISHRANAFKALMEHMNRA